MSGLFGHRVLVLNSSWEPLRVVSWQRAVLLLMGGKIEVLDTYDFLIRSPSISLKLPSVVRMKGYVALKRQRNLVRFSRQHVFLRDEFRCQYCRKEFSGKELTLDHVIPVVKGGKKTWSNIVACCVPCNQKKGARTPGEAGFHGFSPPLEPQFGFIPEILVLKDRVPPSWEPYVSHIRVPQTASRKKINQNF